MLSPARRSIAVTGVVQGVGFRPFVHSLASRLGLRGFVRNRAGGVIIEVEGAADALDRFVIELRGRPPPLARIEELSCEDKQPRGEAGFRIDASESRPGGTVFISPDVATCPDCLRELDDPGDRRHRYPFLNCANCGPRLTIVTGAPYDRERTTMAAFAMCAQCRREYDDPRDRRFHAQPTCCPRCGPSLRVLDARALPVDAPDPVAYAARALLEGRIGAIKGLGGYHLACDARSERAVVALRARKSREEKPFAIMVADLAAAEALAHVSGAERELLLSPARPIVLLRRLAGAPVAPSVAPRDPLLGIMLPYTPLYHLLLRETRAPLVMTSGNRSDEPIAHEEADAFDRLQGIADFFLAHDRPIHTRCDDSVVRVVGGRSLPIRRSRGSAPMPSSLPVPLREPTLALGGQLKSVFALAEERHAFLSHHLGDLDHPAALRAWEQSIARYRELCRIEPRHLVHDLHPDYASTRWAEEQALPRIAVQHHHAHFASCLAENVVRGPAIGVCFDGTGYGLDGTSWGGEFLVSTWVSRSRASTKRRRSASSSCSKRWISWASWRRRHHEIPRRVPRRGRGAQAARRDLAHGSAAVGPDGGVRRPDPQHRQVRDRRVPPWGDRARPRAGMSGVRHFAGDDRSRARHRRSPRRDLLLVRRHAARAGLTRRPAGAEIAGSRRAHRLLPARRGEAGGRQPQPLRGLPRHRLRDPRA